MAFIVGLASLAELALCCDPLDPPRVVDCPCCPYGCVGPSNVGTSFFVCGHTKIPISAALAVWCPSLVLLGIVARFGCRCLVALCVVRVRLFSWPCFCVGLSLVDCSVVISWTRFFASLIVAKNVCLDVDWILNPILTSLSLLYSASLISHIFMMISGSSVCAFAIMFFMCSLCGPAICWSVSCSGL